MIVMIAQTVITVLIVLDVLMQEINSITFKIVN